MEYLITSKELWEMLMLLKNVNEILGNSEHDELFSLYADVNRFFVKNPRLNRIYELQCAEKALKATHKVKNG